MTVSFILFSSYDVYTPTQNIVYHNFQPNPDGHGAQEWMRPRFQRQRKASVERILAYLSLPGGDNNKNLANLGIYGLGKRRTMKQLSDFVGLDMKRQKGRAPTVRNSACMMDGWMDGWMDDTPKRKQMVLVC